MTFLGPAFLMALPLVAVPVLLHLLHRRQQKRIAWGAMQFLLAAATRRRRLWHLTDLLLLLLRAAAFLAFILALAQPLLALRGLGGGGAREVVLVLDPSLSTTRRAGGSTVFERELADADRWLGRLGTGDSVRVLLAGESPEWLQREAVAVGSAAFREVRERIAALKPHQGSADLLGAVREAADLAAAPGATRRVIAVFSDGQKHGWRAGDTAAWEAVRARIEKASVPTRVTLEWAASGTAEANLAVQPVEVPRAVGAAGQSLGFSVTVVNHSREPSAAALLDWRIAGQSAGVGTVPSLAPGAGTTLTLEHVFPAAGTFEVVARLDSRDALAGDDEARCLVDLHERLPVLVVTDPASARAGTGAAAGALESDAGFLLAALGAVGGNGPEGGWHSVFQPVVVGPDAVAEADLRSFRCVVLADPGPLDGPAQEAIEARVRAGGGLWFALGARTDPAVFNAQWHRGGAGPAPLKLLAPVGDPGDRDRFVTVRAASDRHPATVLLADFQRLDLDQARVYRRHVFDAGAAREVSVLLQAQGGDPVVAERRWGAGRVVEQGVPLGFDWSSLPLCQAYVAMVHEWLWYLSEPDLPRRNLAVGEALRLPAAPGAGPARLELPDGRELELAPSGPPSRPEYRLASARLPGRHQLRVPGASSGAGAGVPFEVRRNPEESDLAAFAPGESVPWEGFGSIGVGVGLEDRGASAEGPPPLQPLAGTLLACLPFLLLGEMLLRGWLTHRRHRPLAPVTVEEWAR